MARHEESLEQVRRYYDALGEKEWTRLTRNVRGRVSLEVHRRFLRRFVAPGARVLMVGAGPGRFTHELAQIGARIVVTDVFGGPAGAQREAPARDARRAGRATARAARRLRHVALRPR